MAVEPRFDALDLGQGVWADFLRQQLFMLAGALGLGQLGLPTVGEDKMDGVVESGVAKIFPLVGVEPDSPAAAAATGSSDADDRAGWGIFNIAINSARCDEQLRGFCL
jgi:hypothetical protein